MWKTLDKAGCDISVSSGTNWAEQRRKPADDVVPKTVVGIQLRRSFADQLRCCCQEGLARINRTLCGPTGLHVIEQKASVRNGEIDEFRLTMEVSFILKA